MECFKNSTLVNPKKGDAEIEKALAITVSDLQEILGGNNGSEFIKISADKDHAAQAEDNESNGKHVDDSGKVKPSESNTDKAKEVR